MQASTFDDDQKNEQGSPFELPEASADRRLTPRKKQNKTKDKQKKISFGSGLGWFIPSTTNAHKFTTAANILLLRVRTVATAIPSCSKSRLGVRHATRHARNP